MGGVSHDGDDEEEEASEEAWEEGRGGGRKRFDFVSPRKHLCNFPEVLRWGQQ